MPEDTRTDQIERAINREVAGALTIQQHGAGTFSVVPRSMSELLEFSKLMAISGICIRPHFRGNPGACLAITLQAMKWGADPFAVANKAFEVNGQLAYESQLIHAIVNSSPALAKRLNVTYAGAAQERRCLVTGWIKGEDAAREYESPRLADITPKNSPLWKTDPDQQLFYYSTRAWARRWVPEVLLGIYAPDEMQARTIEMAPEPEPRREDYITQREPEPEPEPQFSVVDWEGVVREFHTVEKAEEALAMVLTESAKRGLDALNAACGDNPTDEWPKDAAERINRVVLGLVKGFAEKVPEPPLASVQAEPPKDTPAPEQAPPAAPQAPRARSVPRRDPPPDDLLQQRTAATTENEPPGERKSQRIAPCDLGGKVDWRSWAVALFFPALRGKTDSSDLAFLLGDNEENIERAKAAGFKDEIDAAIKAQWSAVPA